MERTDSRIGGFMNFYNILQKIYPFLLLAQLISTIYLGSKEKENFKYKKIRIAVAIVVIIFCLIQLILSYFYE